MGRVFSSSDVIDVLKQNGWVLDRVSGSHHVFKKEGAKNHVTIPHPRKHMPIGTLKSIERQSGIKIR